MHFNFAFLSLNKIIFFLLSFLIVVYSLYIFALPKIITDESVEKFANNFLSNNTKLVLDVDKIYVSPDYKFNINIKANKFKLKYKDTNKDFIAVNGVNIDISLINLLFGYVDANKVKLDNVVLSIDFDKNKYRCFDYFSLKLLDYKNDNLDLKLRTLNISIDKLMVLINDRQINKTFIINTKNIKLSKKQSTIGNILDFDIKVKGNITVNKYKISDFILNLNLKLDDDYLNNLNNLIKNFNYNPLRYTLEYKFYTKATIDLKSKVFQNKIRNNGVVALNEMSFESNGIRIPKNNLVLNFKGNKIISDFNFNFFKNQYAKVKSEISLDKSSFVEAKIESSELNLTDIMPLIKCFIKIINPKFNIDDLTIKGILKANLYIKSNFKSLYSDGNLNIANASLYSKQYNVFITNINSQISLKNNKIDIKNTSALFDKAKFNIAGSIDKSANTNIKLRSDLINIAKILNMMNHFPIFGNLAKTLKNCVFYSGELKIDSDIFGKLSDLQIKSNSYLNNLKFVYVPKNMVVSINKINIIPDIENGKLIKSDININNFGLNFKEYNLKINNLKLEALKNKIIIHKTNAKICNLDLFFDGEISDYLKPDNAKLDLNFNTHIADNNNFIKFNIKNLFAYGNLTFKNDELTLNECVLKTSNSEVAKLYGKIDDIFSKNLSFNKFKMITLQKLTLKIVFLNNLLMEIKSDIELNGKLNNLKINGRLNIYKLEYNPLSLKVYDAFMDLIDSVCYLNITNATIMNFKFDLASEIRYVSNKLLVKYASFESDYIDINSIQKYFNKTNMDLLKKIQIDSLKGNVNRVDFLDIALNNLKIDGNFNNNILTLSKFSADLLNGNANGELVFNLMKNKISADVVLKDINVRLLSSKIKELSIAATGKLSALIRAEFIGFSYNEILKTLDGYIKFNINDGELAQFAKLERFLQAGNILSQSILKLSINSVLSTVNKQNTGYFKSIEGTVKIKDSWANIQYIKTKGTNMSLYLFGRFNLLTEYGNINVFGKIPYSIVNVMGPVGRFAGENIVNKMSQDAKNIINSLAESPIEKMLSEEIPEKYTSQIPELYMNDPSAASRVFKVNINGNIRNSGSVKNFKWGLRNN